MWHPLQNIFMHERLFVMIISKSEKKSRTENFRKAKVICYRLWSLLPSDVEQSMGFVVRHPTRKYSGRSQSFFYAKMIIFIFILDGYIVWRIKGLKMCTTGCRSGSLQAQSVQVPYRNVLNLSRTKREIVRYSRVDIDFSCKKYVVYDTEIL